MRNKVPVYYCNIPVGCICALEYETYNSPIKYQLKAHHLLKFKTEKRKSASGIDKKNKFHIWVGNLQLVKNVILKQMITTADDKNISSIHTIKRGLNKGYQLNTVLVSHIGKAILAKNNCAIFRPYVRYIRHKKYCNNQHRRKYQHYMSVENWMKTYIRWWNKTYDVNCIFSITHCCTLQTCQ